MRNKISSARRLVLSVAAAASLALSACNLGKAEATPTMSADAIYTAAFHTFTAQEATRLALTPSATVTPQPSSTPPPTFTVAAPIGGATTAAGGQLCNSSVYVNDVTIPVGTVIAPGKNFVKTWTVMNKGTCNWTTSYKLTFISGDAMGGSSVPVPGSVPAGQQTQISASLIAPTNPGDYTGTWQLEDPNGVAFGDVITVVIKVSGGGSGSTNTPGTPAAAQTPPTAATP